MINKNHLFNKKIWKCLSLTSDQYLCVLQNSIVMAILGFNKTARLRTICSGSKRKLLFFLILHRLLDCLNFLYRILSFWVLWKKCFSRRLCKCTTITGISNRGICFNLTRNVLIVSLILKIIFLFLFILRMWLGYIICEKSRKIFFWHGVLI